jgi:membrane protease YdiL (CAAX protease family)
MQVKQTGPSRPVPNDLLDGDAISPLPVRLVSATAFTLLAVISLVLPAPSSVYVKLASGLVLLAGCLVFLAGRSRLLAPAVFLTLAYLTRCLPFYSLFLMLAIPLSLYGLLVWKAPGFYLGRRGFTMGQVERRSLIVTIVVTAISITGITVWYIIGDADFSGFTDSFSDRGTVAVILWGLAFSIVNVFVSETIFRGILWQGLEECLITALPVVLIQGLLYGASHYWGAVPNGWEGAILSGIFGLFLGIIRLMSRGILMPMISHVCIDLTLLVLILHSLERL